MGTTEITALPGQPVIEMRRDFAAPRALLHRAYTDPALVTQWLGPKKYEMVIDRWEMQDGGRYRYVHRDAAGNAYAFHGVFHSTSIEGMVQTFEFEGAPGHVSMDSLWFDEHDGRTTIRVRSVFQSVEDRDAMVAAGMADGVNQGYDRLEALLPGLMAHA
ncbi:MAG: SRPBCC family protein [Candidatus Limnocylindrales bacterium]